MCAICDGATYDEMLAGLHGVVQRFGWAVQGVEASTPWTYTIGLTERFGHPELVLAGIDISLAMNILNALADRVAGGEQLRPGGPNVTVGETELRLGSVHPVHLASGLVGYWRMYYEWRGGAPPPLEVVQVLPPLGDRLRLDRPHTRLKL